MKQTWLNKVEKIEDTMIKIMCKAKKLKLTVGSLVILDCTAEFSPIQFPKLDIREINGLEKSVSLASYAWSSL
jgi:hypothetical protein